MEPFPTRVMTPNDPYRAGGRITEEKNWLHLGNPNKGDPSMSPTHGAWEAYIVPYNIHKTTHRSKIRTQHLMTCQGFTPRRTMCELSVTSTLKGGTQRVLITPIT